MEHSCYRCQAEIAEGAAFCAHCGAPQIRVALPETDAQPASPDATGTQFPAQQTSWLPPGAYAPQPGAILWPLAWRGALISGLAAAVLSGLPFVQMGCLLWMLGAGALSVALYRRHAPGTLITPGMGMKLGALAGLFGWLANAVVSTMTFVALRNSGNFRRAMEDAMTRQLAGNTDPKVHEMMQNLLEWMSTPQGAATVVVLSIAAFGVIFVLITAAGGAIGASMFGQRRDFR